MLATYYIKFYYWTKSNGLSPIPIPSFYIMKTW